MKRGLVNARITPSMDDGSVIVRLARKQHHCAGGHDGKQRTPCHVPIHPHTIYIEYLGESYAYESGARYHLTCAAQQGLIEFLSNAEVWNRGKA